MEAHPLTRTQNLLNLYCTVYISSDIIIIQIYYINTPTIYIYTRTIPINKYVINESLQFAINEQILIPSPGLRNPPSIRINPAQLSIIRIFPLLGSFGCRLYISERDRTSEKENTNLINYQKLCLIRVRKNPHLLYHIYSYSICWRRVQIHFIADCKT